MLPITFSLILPSLLSFTAPLAAFFPSLLLLASSTPLSGPVLPSGPLTSPFQPFLLSLIPCLCPYSPSSFLLSPPPFRSSPPLPIPPPLPACCGQEEWAVPPPSMGGFLQSGTITADINGQIVGGGGGRNDSSSWYQGIIGASCGKLKTQH